MQKLFEFIVKNKITSEYTDNADCVDLDLPSGTLWATCNIGAYKPEEYGGYYQWGGLEDMSNKTCDWTTVPFNDGNNNFDKDVWGKYKDKILDNNGNLKLEYDVAYKESKGILRMPTKDEVKELIDYTDNEWLELNDIRGKKFISKKNKSKWMFIPAAGCRYDSSIIGNGSYCGVWSLSLSNSSPLYAWCASIDYNFIYPDRNFRCDGFSVRGVKI